MSELNRSADKAYAMDKSKDIGIAETGERMHGVNAQIASRDKALVLLGQNHVSFDPNSEEARRVRRKIDRRIMPLIFTVYLLQLLDKNSLSFAAIMGIKDSAHLTASQYSWLGSIVYFGYLGGDVPSIFLMQRLSIAKYLSVMCMIWGVIVALHAACHSFGSLAAVRFILGAIEVCTVPVAIQITSAFYTKEEQVVRVALWYTTSGWGGVFGGFFAWCIYNAKSFRWQGLFILYGGMTFVTGLIMFFLLAASPTEAKWLTEEEKVIALERVRHNKTGTEVWKFSWPQLKEALMDVRLYMMFLLLASSGLPNGGVTAFGPTIISGFGFTTAQTTLLNMGPGAAQVVGTILALFLARRTSRTFAGAATLLLAAVGCVMMFVIPSSNYKARYGGYVLVYQYPVCVLFIITFLTSGVAGTTKRFAFSCSYQLGYAVGNIIGPQTYRAKDAPNYYPAKYTMLAFLLFNALLITTYGMLHKIWNKRRDKRDTLEPGVSRHVENEEFIDITDFKLRSFRYPV